jgi:hypothetical protein
MVRQVLSLSIVCMLMFSQGTAGLALAGTLSTDERRKIETLLEHLAQLEDANFVRNGVAYNSRTAVTFLRRKWEANDDQVNSAREFIERIASLSSTSGKPYLIRFQDGAEVTAEEYLVAQLKRIEAQAKEAKRTQP